LRETGQTLWTLPEATPSNAFEGDEIRVLPSYSPAILHKLSSLCCTSLQDKNWEGDDGLSADDILSFCLEKGPDEINKQSKHLLPSCDRE